MFSFPVRPKKLLVISIVIIVASSLVFSGCSLKGGKKPTPKQGKTPSQPVKIGVAMATMEGEGSKAVKKAMEKIKATEKVELTWVDAKNDLLTQNTQVDELVKKKVKVIILQIVDPKAGPQLISRIQQQQIKVVALTSLPENVPLDGYVAPDFLRAGEVQGQFVARKVTKGEVIVLTTEGFNQASKVLYTGFQQSLPSGSPLAVKKVTMPDTLEAVIMEQEVFKTLQAHPNAVAVVAQSGSQTAALLKFLKTDQAKATVLTTVGLGGDKDAALALAAGLHDAEVDIRPDLMAYYALKGAKLLAEGQNVDYDQRVKSDESDVPVKVIPVRLIKSENVYLLEERWGKLKQQAEEQEKKQGQSRSKSGGSSDESTVQSGGQGKKSKLIIKTKEGKTMEIEIDGEIQEIKSQAAESSGQGGQGGKEGQGSQDGNEGQDSSQ
jgi:ABC-type sugar transport system substrate-binding protein